MKERLLNDIAFFLSLILSQMFLLAYCLTDGIGVLFMAVLWMIANIIFYWLGKKYKKEE